MTRLSAYEQAQIARETHWQAIREICADLRNWPTGHPQWQSARRTSIWWHLYRWREAVDAMKPEMRRAA